MSVFEEVAREFAASIELEYNAISPEKKAAIIECFGKGVSVNELNQDFDVHVLVVARIVEEGMQASVIESLCSSPFREHFKKILARMSVAYAENMSEKGDSWRTLDLDDLREKAKEEFLEWMDAQGSSEELSEIADVGLTILMLGERL